MLLVSSGCISFSTLHSAKPVPQGTTETALGASYYGFGYADDSVEVPYTEVAVRYGVSGDADVGFKVFPLGFAMDFNYAVLNEDAMVLSLNPYVSVTRLSAGSSSLTYGFAGLNVLADVVSSDPVTLTVGLKPGWLYALGSGEDDSEFGTGAVVGGMMGLRVKMGDTIAIMPNFDTLTPIDNLGDVWIYNFGIAVLF